MTKVCHLTSVHQNNDVRIFKKECVSLAKAGYEVYLVAHGESSYTEGVHIVGIGDFHTSRLKRMLVATRVVYKKALEIDAKIYHVHDPELLSCALRLKRKGKKVIYDSHENYVMQIKKKVYLPKIISSLIAKAYYLYETAVVKKLDAVIFPCTMDGENIFQNRAKRTEFISNAPLLAELYDRYNPNFAKDQRTIVHVGMLSHERGITHLVKAADKAQVKLILAGKFVSPEYFQSITAMPEFKAVDYRGFVSREEVLDICSQANIGLCTLLNVGQYYQADNLATKVYEYMSLGLPVIISDTPYAKKINEEYKFGICVNPESVDDIAEAIAYLLDNPETAKKMGVNGRTLVLEKLNWGIEEKKLLALYEQLLGG